MKRNTSLSMCAFALALLLLLCVSMAAQNNTAQAGVLTKSDVNRAVHSDVSPPLRDLISSQPVSPFGFHEASPALKPKLQKQLQFAAQRGVPTAAVAPDYNAQPLAAVSATIGANILGVGVGFHGYTVPDAPPDVNAASGDWPGNQPNAQVVQWVNVSYAVFRKSDGAYLAGPILGNALWSNFGGQLCEVKNSGDGFLATFDGPARAVNCAAEIIERVESLGLSVRAGVHTGECERREDDVAGIAVHIASRVMHEAGPGEVLASSTVKELVVGSGLKFADRGPHTLKGVEDEWRLYALER